MSDPFFAPCRGCTDLSGCNKRRKCRQLYGTKALPPLQATPDLPISYFLNGDVPTRAITGFDGKEARAVSIADCRRYAEAYARACLAAAATPSLLPVESESGERKQEQENDK